MHTSQKTLSAVFILAIASCLVTLMAVFLGADSPAIGITLLLQGAIFPIATAVWAIATWRGVRRIGWSDLTLLYRRLVPGWMWFIFWSINSLAIAGEMALWIAFWASSQPPGLLQHAPLLCSISCTMALLSLYMWQRVEHPEI